jgi:hypothetical protein
VANSRTASRTGGSRTQFQQPLTTIFDREIEVRYLRGGSGEKNDKPPSDGESLGGCGRFGRPQQITNSSLLNHFQLAEGKEFIVW